MNTKEYHHIVTVLRKYFNSLGYLEVEAQSRLGILAACENPSSIMPYTLRGDVYPLHQTNQMVLESELLTHPEYEGLFCVTTSYRDEKNAIAGRHEIQFPLFEWEGRGDIEDLCAIEEDTLKLLGFDDTEYIDYNYLLNKWGVESIEAEEEDRIRKEYGNVVSLCNFPLLSNPFFNMKDNGNGTFAKVDVILCGIESIGSAERETDVYKMRKNFYAATEGKYAEALIALFGEDRVEKELDEYLALSMVKRFGGAYGLGRVSKAMKTLGLFK